VTPTFLPLNRPPEYLGLVQGQDPILGLDQIQQLDLTLELGPIQELGLTK